MNDEYLQIRKQAQELLSELSIIDGNAFLNSLLFELSETDNSNIDLKSQILEDIKKLLKIKSAIRVKNDDFYYLKNLIDRINMDQENTIKINSLIKVINSSKEEKYFLTQKAANDYINSLDNKDNVSLLNVECKELEELLNVLKHNF